MELHAVQAYYDANHGLVELEDDVLSIVRQVRERYGGKVKINWEPTTEHYVFIENCADGTERLIFTTPHLDGRDLERLFKADAALSGHEDPYDRQEREQDDEFAARDEAKLEELREQGEKLAHALKQDGVEDSRYPTQVAVPRDLSG